MEVPYILRNKWVQLASVAVVAFAGGSAGGYILGKRQVHREVVDELREVQLSLFDQNNTTQMYSPDARLTSEEVEEILDEADIDIDEPGERILRIVETTTTATTETVEEEPEPPVVINVFTNDDEDWDWEAELSARHPNAPYILHQDEFVNDEMGYRQETLTYYAGDDVMADSTDTPIYDHNGLMGELRFGHGSKDKNVVYIRNEAIHMEWEILLSNGSFAIEVLGLDQDREAEEEIRHSIRSVQKFRRD